MPVISDLVNVEELKERDYFNEERGDVSFYCKDCEKIVETDRPKPNAYIFICKICGGKNVAIWTREWLKTAYKIKE